jgi:hypothetical protein
MIHPLVLSLPSPAIISPRPRRHRHHTTTPPPSLPSHSRSLHHHRFLRVTPLVASRGGQRRIVRGATMGLFTVTKKATTPFEGQKPGTSGLRKKVFLPALAPPDLRLGAQSGSLCFCGAAGSFSISGASDPLRDSLSLPATSRISPGAAFRAGSRGSVLSVRPAWI